MIGKAKAANFYHRGFRQRQRSRFLAFAKQNVNKIGGMQGSARDGVSRKINFPQDVPKWGC